jgi:hypothetical protein
MIFLVGLPFVNTKIPTFFVIVLSLLNLIGCTHNSTSSIAESPVCKTIHSGAGIDLKLSKKIIVIPASVESNGNGFTTIVIPTAPIDPPRISANLILQENSKWYFNSKNQVFAWVHNTGKEIKIDLSPNLKITKGERRILVLKISINAFPIILQPVTSGERISGSPITYAIKINNAGVTSVFSSLEHPISGQELSQELSNILDKTRQGDYLLPKDLINDITLMPPEGASVDLCPPSK